MKLLIKIVILIIAVFVYFHWASEATADVEPTVAAQPQEEAQESAGVVLERARILERVDRDYEEALHVYRELVDSKPAPEILEKAELGATQCLMKLGRYDEAEKILHAMQQRSLSVEMIKTVDDLLASIARLNTRERPESASSVDNLVWQLLDMGAGNDEEKAIHACDEIVKMGVLAVPILKEAALDRDYVRSVLAFRLLVESVSEGVPGFINACVKDPDLALRKRCLDGLTEGRVCAELVPALMILLDDAEESLQVGALSCFSRDYSRFHGKIGGQIDEVTGTLLEFYTSDSERLRDAAFEAAGAIAHSLSRYPVDEFPLDEIAVIALKALSENYPLRDLDSRSYDRLKSAMHMAFLLGTEFGHVELLEQLALFWFVDPVILQNLGSGPRAFFIASADRLPIDRFEKIVRTIIEDHSAAVSDYFAANCPYTAFSPLSAETQIGFIKKWARNANDAAGGKSNTISRAIVHAPPPLWATFVSSVLQNESAEVVSKLLGGIADCPDPSDPACIDALCAWAARSADGRITKPWRLIEMLIKRGDMDPGREGALRILENALSAIEEPMRIWRYQGGAFTYSPTGGQDEALGILDVCQGFGVPGEVRQWILEQRHPGLHDYLLVNGRTRKTMVALLSLDREFALRLWPHLSIRGQEAMFEKIWVLVSDSYRNSKPDWLIELLSQIESLDGWQDNNVEYILKYLGRWRESSMPDLAAEIGRIVFKNPERYSQFKDRLELFGDLLEATAPKSEKVMSLIPMWYTKIGSMSNRYAPSMESIVRESRENLTRALRWLVEEESVSLKYNVLEGIVSVDAAALKDLGLEDELRAVWPDVDHDTRALLVYYLTTSMNGTEAAADFLISLLSDESADLAVRHMALPALLLGGGADVVDPVLAYLAGLEPGAGDGPMDVVTKIEMDFKTQSKSNFEFLFDRSRGIPEKEAGAKFGNFAPRDRQRLCRGILNLSVIHPRLRSRASQEIAINDDDDLEAMAAALKFGDCYYLFERSVEYMLGKAQEDSKRDDSSKAALQERAESILIAALNGEFDAQNSSTSRKALDLIKRFSPANLLGHVGQIAINNPDVYMRGRAVACLAAYGRTEAVPYLLECLKDPDTKQVSGPALQILERMRRHEEQREAWEAMMGDGARSGLPSNPATALVEMLRHDDVEIRIAAIKSLGKLADPNVLPVLVQMMADGTLEEREAAKAAIDAITAE